MREEYLHHIWQQKRLPFHKLKSVEGEELEVLNTGWLNPDSGPDFFSGSVVIDGIKWSGNIELHINSSDWYKHNHHKDQAYENVVLHVVLNHDKDVFIRDRKLPTIELKNFIDTDHFNKYNSLLKENTVRPCHTFILESPFIHEQIENALFQRMARKSSEMAVLKKNFTLTNIAVFYLFMAQAFGGRANKDSFRELSLNLNFNLIKKENWSEKRIDSLVFGLAGFLNDSKNGDDYYLSLSNEWKHLKRKYRLESMNNSSWKFSGIRPPSFPTIKLAQYAQFLNNKQFSIDEGLTSKEILKQFKKSLGHVDHSYWSFHYHFGKKSKRPIYALSNQFINQLVINGLVPYLFFLGQEKNDFSIIDKALNMLEAVPSEKNSVIEKWRDDKVIPKNASESQGLLELNNEFCNFRRCLNCKVGQQLLNSE